MNTIKKPLVSVITCAYNEGKYLKECIESVLTQTYTNIEYIIWDDGSTDNTKQIVDSFDDKRISYYHSKNMGIGYSTVMACKKANGVYIARIDGDDVWFTEDEAKGIYNTMFGEGSGYWNGGMGNPPSLDDFLAWLKAGDGKYHVPLGDTLPLVLIGLAYMVLVFMFKRK